MNDKNAHAGQARMTVRYHGGPKLDLSTSRPNVNRFLDWSRRSSRITRSTVYAGQLGKVDGHPMVNQGQRVHGGKMQARVSDGGESKRPVSRFSAGVNRASASGASAWTKRRESWGQHDLLEESGHGGTLISGG